MSLLKISFTQAPPDAKTLQRVQDNLAKRIEAAEQAVATWRRRVFAAGVFGGTMVVAEVAWVLWGWWGGNQGDLAILLSLAAMVALPATLWLSERQDRAESELRSLRSELHELAPADPQQKANFEALAESYPVLHRYQQYLQRQGRDLLNAEYLALFDFLDQHRERKRGEVQPDLSRAA